MKKILFIFIIFAALNEANAGRVIIDSSHNLDSKKQTKYVKTKKNSKYDSAKINSENPIFSLSGDVIKYHIQPYLDDKTVISLKLSCRRFYMTVDDSVFAARVPKNISTLFAHKTSFYAMYIGHKIYIKAKRNDDKKMMKKAAKMGHLLAKDSIKKKRAENFASFMEYMKTTTLTAGSAMLNLPLPIPIPTRIY